MVVDERHTRDGPRSITHDRLTSTLRRRHPFMAWGQEPAHGSVRPDARTTKTLFAPTRNVALPGWAARTVLNRTAVARPNASA